MTRRWLGGLGTLWAYLNGDTAYRRYLDHKQTAHPGEAVMDRRSFYLWRLDQRYTGINRCC